MRWRLLAQPACVAELSETDLTAALRSSGWWQLRIQQAAWGVQINLAGARLHDDVLSRDTLDDVFIGEGVEQFFVGCWLVGRMLGEEFGEVVKAQAGGLVDFCVVVCFWLIQQPVIVGRDECPALFGPAEGVACGRAFDDDTLVVF